MQAGKYERDNCGSDSRREYHLLSDAQIPPSNRRSWWQHQRQCHARHETANVCVVVDEAAEAAEAHEQDEPGIEPDPLADARGDGVWKLPALEPSHQDEEAHQPGDAA